MATPTILQLDALNASMGIGDAFFYQFLSDHGTGSGNYEAFLQIKAQGNNTTEAGFNTDANSGGILDDMPSAQFTHSLDFSTMQAVSTAPDGTDLGQEYVVFRLDLGEKGTGQNPDAHITLTEFKVFQNGNPAPTTIPSGNLVYDLDAGGDKSVLLNDFSSGNGQSDYLIYVPKSDFSTDPAVKYVTVYANFSGVDSTFEEFGYIKADNDGPEKHAAISIEKVTLDGTTTAGTVATDFANGDDGLIIAGDGHTITWIYQVTNTSPDAVDLNNVVVTDDQGVTVTQLTNGNGDAVLSQGETWYFAGTGPSVANTVTNPDDDPDLGPIVGSNYTNVGTVTADPVGGGTSVTGFDPSNYFGATGGVTLDKVTVDDTTVGDDNTFTILAGETITWRYTVTNAGNVAQTVTLSDSDIGPISLLDLVSGDTHNLGLLDIDETWVYEVSGLAVTGPYSNTGTATGTWTDSAGVDHTPLAATDDSGYFGAAPSIAIDKITIDNTINVQGDGIWVNEGDSLTWQYTVTNTGNVGLSNIVVTDDQQGPITNYTGDGGTLGVLDVGESWTYTASGTAGDGTYTNTGMVTGEFTDTAGHSPVDPITDSDDSGYVTTATLGHSKGYWANHAGTGPGNQANAWDAAANTNLVIGDGDPNGDTPDFSIARAGAVVLMNTNTTGDARLIFAGQAEAAQLNAYAAGVTANGLLDSAADWLNTAGGGQDGNDVLAGEYTVNKNSFSFVEGSKVSTTSTAWKGDAFSFGYNSNEDSGNAHVVHVTGEGLKNILEAYDLASSGNGLVVSSDGSLVGWMSGNVVSHVYNNTPLAFAAVVNEAEHAGLVTITGVYDNPNNYNLG